MNKTEILRPVKHHIPLRLSMLIFLFDVLAIVCALVATLKVPSVFPSLFSSENYFPSHLLYNQTSFHYLALFFLVLISFASKGHYTRRIPWWDQVRYIHKVIIVGFILSGFIYFTFAVAIPRYVIFISWFVVLCFTLLARRIAFHIVDLFPDWKLHVVLLGDRQMVMDCMYAFYADGLTGYEVKVILLRDTNKEPFCLDFIPKEHPPIELITEHDNYDDYIKANPHYFYIIGLDGFRSTDRDRLMKTLDEQEIEYAILPPTKRMHLHGMEPYFFFGNDVMLLRHKKNTRAFLSRVIKRSFDIIASGLALPLLGLITLLVIVFKRIEGAKTPIFYGGPRVGRKGRLFNCWKFCTMHRDADKILAELMEKDPLIKAEWEEFKKLKRDPRVDSKISRLLRKTSLDELPQLWNVFVGDMSLVGPRPILPEQIDDYGENIKDYNSMRPGITGLWQVSGRNETSFGRRIYWDSWYIRNWSLWHDVVILFKTVSVLITGRGAY